MTGDASMLYAPWDQATVDALNRWQTDGQFHPFTCTSGHDLVATPAGWVCPIGACGYTQDWAWPFMAHWRGDIPTDG